MVCSINRTASTMQSRSIRVMVFFLLYIHKLISQSRSRKRGFPKLSHHDGIGHIDTDGDHALQGNRNGDNCHFFIKTFVFYQ